LVEFRVAEIREEKSATGGERKEDNVGCKNGVWKDETNWMFDFGNGGQFVPSYLGN